MVSSPPGLGPGFQPHPTPTLAELKDCEKALAWAAQPKLGIAKIQGFTHRMGPVPTSALPASVSGSSGRQRSCSEGCAVPF